MNEWISTLIFVQRIQTLMYRYVHICGLKYPQGSIILGDYVVVSQKHINAVPSNNEHTIHYYFHFYQFILKIFPNWCFWFYFLKAYFNLSSLLLRIFVTCTLLFTFSWNILGKIHYTSAINCCSNFQRRIFCYILTHISPTLYFWMFSYFIISNTVVPSWT